MLVTGDSLDATASLLASVEDATGEFCPAAFCRLSGVDKVPAFGVFFRNLREVARADLGLARLLIFFARGDALVGLRLLAVDVGIKSSGPVMKSKNVTLKRLLDEPAILNLPPGRAFRPLLSRLKYPGESSTLRLVRVVLAVPNRPPGMLLPNLGRSMFIRRSCLADLIF